MMEKTMVALYALRVQRLAGPCMIALCDLFIKHQTPSSAVQACVTLKYVSSPFLPTLIF